jgi:chromosome segregation ATPase
MKSTLVKTFLVLNFLLIIGVAVFSFFIFRDREVIKASTLLGLDAVEDTAQNLRWSGQVDWETEEDRKSEAFQISLPLHMDEMKDFEERLVSLETYAAFRIEQLEQQYAILLETRATLAQTRETLSIRTQERDAARVRITELRGDLAALEDRLEEAKDTAADLEREKRTLERQVADLESEIRNREEQISYLEGEIALRVQERDQIQALYEACEGRGRAGEHVFRSLRSPRRCLCRQVARATGRTRRGRSRNPAGNLRTGHVRSGG